MAPNSKNTTILVVNFYTVLISVQMELSMILFDEDLLEDNERVSDIKFRGHSLCNESLRLSSLQTC